MYIHIALYAWKPETTIEDIHLALRDVEALADKVPGIIEISTAKNDSKYNEGYTHVIYVVGESQAAIDAYRAHPNHATVATKIDSMEAKGVGVDFSTDSEA